MNIYGEVIEMPTDLQELLSLEWTKLRPGRQMKDGTYLTILLNDTQRAQVKFTISGRFISCDYEDIPEE